MSGVTIGRVALLTDARKTRRLRAISHKLADYTMFIIFGVSMFWRPCSNGWDDRRIVVIKIVGVGAFFLLYKTYIKIILEQMDTIVEKYT